MKSEAKLRLGTFFIIALICQVNCLGAAAMTFNTSVLPNGIHVLVGSGEILPGDDDKLVKMINEGSAEDRVVAFDSPGGDLIESLSLARTIRYYGFEAVVPSNSRCASACFFLFTGAQFRYVFPAASSVFISSGGKFRDCEPKGHTAYSSRCVEIQP
ncbi:hypothetical protein AJ87_08830 [Rhizobium yanglingense]|nr:hypothetical protein AJ87_08830 [Rhizobium yanglingense]